MSNPAIDFLNRQNEEIDSMIVQHRFQLNIIKNWPEHPDSFEKVLEDNLTAMLKHQNKIQKGLSMLTGDDSFKKQYEALNVANTGYAETLH